VGTVMWANEALLDRLMISADGDDVGMVDDLELSDGAHPELTALLSGSIAFGPRVGGRLGSWWSSIGRRLRPDDDPHPNRVPISDVRKLDHRGVVLAVEASQLGTRRMYDWARTNVIERIPGNGS
jgi:hypothetical protein